VPGTKGRAQSREPSTRFASSTGSSEPSDAPIARQSPSVQHSVASIKSVWFSGTLTNLLENGELLERSLAR